MTLCPHCTSSNIRYRYYRSSSWVDTWKCDICKDEIYSGNNYYHCRPCCDRGGSSHEPEVKRCSGMYCTYCVNTKNNDWQQEKRKLQADKEAADKKAEIAEKALKDEEDRQIKAQAEKKKTAKATLNKSITFCNTCAKKVAQIQSLTDESKSAEGDIPTLDELTQTSTEFTKLIQQNKANLDSIQEANKGLITEAEGNNTYDTEQEMQSMMDQITEQQEVISVHKQKVRERIKKVNEQEIDIIKQETTVNDALIKTKKEETNLHGVDGQIDSLRKELQGLSGKEVNSNPEAVEKMNKTYDQLLKKLQEKHAENKEKYAELKQVKTNITMVRAKLMNTQKNNKYLLQCLDGEYERLNNVAQDVANKFERRAVYFLSVSVGLQEDTIRLFEEYGIGDDMDGIMELTENDLIDIGVAKKGIRNKILRMIMIKKRKANQN
eukprot:186817_1